MWPPVSIVKLALTDAEKGSVFARNADNRHMSKKHYIQIAAVIAAERALYADNLEVNHALENVTLSLADIFKADNSRFDRARFYAAADATTPTN